MSREETVQEFVPIYKVVRTKDEIRDNTRSRPRAAGLNIESTEIAQNNEVAMRMVESIMHTRVQRACIEKKVDISALLFNHDLDLEARVPRGVLDEGVISAILHDAAAVCTNFQKVVDRVIGKMTGWRGHTSTTAHDLATRLGRDGLAQDSDRTCFSSRYRGAEQARLCPQGAISEDLFPP